MKIAEFKEKMGRISPSEAAREETAASQTEQNTDVTALQNQQKAIAPMGPIGLDDKTLAEWQKLQAEITAAQQKGAQQREQITQQETLRQAQQFQKMFQSITAPMNSFFDHWLTSGRNMGLAFDRMMGQMAMNFINAEIRMLEHHIQVELQKRLATAVGNEAQVVSTAVASAQTHAIETKSAMQSLEKSAAKAAGKAWSALSDIPVVGPILGAAAAAATFTGVMALAAFESGADYIPRMGVAMLHPGEAVATAGENSRISQVINMAQSAAALAAASISMTTPTSPGSTAPVWPVWRRRMERSSVGKRCANSDSATRFSGEHPCRYRFRTLFSRAPAWAGSLPSGRSTRPPCRLRSRCVTRPRPRSRPASFTNWS